MWWSFSDEICGGLVTAMARNITTPNYPRFYPMNKMCEWVITVPGDGKVSLTFDTFQLESDFFCRFDSLLIRDGDRYNSPLIGLFCGYNKPPTITSSSSSLLILFRSDSSISYSGFKASWRKVDTRDTMTTSTPLKLSTHIGKFKRLTPYHTTRPMECDLDSGFQETLLVESRILLFGIRNLALRIRKP